MKKRTREMLDSVDEMHDFSDGQVWGGGGTFYSSTDKCQVCGLVRKWHKDEQNGVGDTYEFESLDGEEVSLADVLAAGCGVVDAYGGLCRG